MTTTLEQMNLPITKDAKLISVYGEQYITIVENAKLYLLRTTVISKYNAIASIDIANNCVIYDRDAANCFVDWSHVHFGKAGQIDSLSDEQIKKYLTFYLQNDTYSLISFSQTELTSDFARIFDRMEDMHKSTILESLYKAKIYSAKEDKFIIPWTQISTKDQMQWAHDNQYTFIFLNAATQHYDCCKRTSDGKYEVICKNGSCGSWAKVSKDLDNCCCILFNQKPGLSIEFTENLESQIAEDIEDSAYYAANKFVKLEEKFNKTLEDLTNRITEQNGYVDMAKVYYPNIDEHAETIAKTVRAYKRNPEDAVKTQECKSILLKEYTAAYTELQKAQDSLKALYALIDNK